MSELLESTLCVALGIQGKQWPLELAVLRSALCGSWLSVCRKPLPPVLSWLAFFLFHALVLKLGCVPSGVGSPVLDGLVCHGR